MKEKQEKINNYAELFQATARLGFDYVSSRQFRADIRKFLVRFYDEMNKLDQFEKEKEQQNAECK